MLKIESILMDYLPEATGVEHVPMLTWKTVCDRANAVQSAYRVQLSHDADFHALLLDTGKVESSESAHVQLDVSLDSAMRYHLRVMVWDDAGIQSDWKAASFVTGVMAQDRRARFITAETSADAGNSKGTYLRCACTVEDDVAEAYISATALGLYHLFLNGMRVGQDEMAPGWTSYDKHLCYQTYDVTGLLHPGDNVIGAHLGAGWYKGKMSFAHDRNIYGDRTALLCQLTIRYRNGHVQTVVTDESWLGCNSPVQFSEIYDGEWYDARLEQPGWDRPGFVPQVDDAFVLHPVSAAEKRDFHTDPYTAEEVKAQIAHAAAHRHTDIRWHVVDLVDYDFSVLTPQPGCRVKVHQLLPVQQIITTPEGDTVLDFGQNLTGWVRFRVSGQPGDMVHLRCFETLDAAGNAYFANLRSAKAEIHYICKGGDAEYNEQFSFQGFRYVKLEQWPCEVEADRFTACVVHSDMQPTGWFTCAHPLVNQLQHNIEWGLRGNFLDIPTDCPQRDERMGWTGDAQIFSRTATFLRNTYPFFSKWLRDVALDQSDDGAVPHMVPNSLARAKVRDWWVQQGLYGISGWADVAVIVPWTVYQAYGDVRILADQFESMRGWIDHMHRHSPDDTWHYGLQLGDWLALDAAEDSYYGATPTELTAQAYYAYSTGLFVKVCQVLGKQELAQQYGALYQRIVDRFRAQYLDEHGVMKVQTQTAHILAIYFGLLPACGVAGTVEGLKRLLAANHGHLSTGFLGTPYLCHALSQHGAVWEAYDLLLREDFPGWLYQVKAGATTIWEHWDGLKPDGTMWSADMNSFNHYAYGAIGEWLYRAVAGIEIDEAVPGYKHTIIAPKTDRRLISVDAGYRSVYGDIAVSWTSDADIITLMITVPFNTTATIVLETTAEAPEGLRFVCNSSGCYQAEVGSGVWKLRYRVME